MKLINSFSGLLIVLIFFSCAETRKINVFEIHEIILTASNIYENPYVDVECWVQLKGHDFNKRVYGFWDGGQTFKVRVAATEPGEWTWISGSNRPDDKGLTGQKGKFEAIEWTEAEKAENPNRRGFIRATSNGHALEYADGTPFFLIGDTWWAASTWRYPLTDNAPDENWEPGPEGHSFENMIHYRKKQGYNSLGMIACFPNWADDGLPPRVVDENGIGIRQAWEKFGKGTAKDMHDEAGNRPFELTDKIPLANYDKINPAFFQSLDNKMDYLHSVGFVPFFETVRRDAAPPWKEYFNWPDSFVRYIQYIVARYGAYNMVFSAIHLDWIIPVFCLPADDFNEALIAWYHEYGPLPYGQPVTSLIIPATHTVYGIGEEVPWLNMHSVGNNPRDNGFFPMLEEQFLIDPPMPTANMEPYYTGWQSEMGGEIIVRNSDRDNYFARTQAWGSVLSGGLAGHQYGTGAYDGTTVGEIEGERPIIWDALKFPAGEQVGYLRRFIESEGGAFQNLVLATGDINPRKSKFSRPNGGFDGWSFMMRTQDKNLAMLYFEDKCDVPELSGFHPDKDYELNWFNPITGEWVKNPFKLVSDKDGKIRLLNFPDGGTLSKQDWGLKIKPGS